MTRPETPSPELLVALQRGIPIVRRPFAALGEQAGAGEEAVLVAVQAMIAQGTARRFGAVFDSRSLGYDSTLCAVDVPPDRLDAVAGRLTPHAGITHCYERAGRPNLWFTFNAPRERFDAGRQKIADLLQPFALLDLPAWRTFKIEAIFDTRLVGRGGTPGAAPYRAGRAASPESPDERERAVVRRLQESIPLVPEPFAALGAELGWDVEDLLALLTRWHESGVLRRIGLIVRHRELGFAANGMCVWAVDPIGVDAAGRILAGFPEVTHCYERRPHALFPYNLFAMIHAAGETEVRQVWARLTAAAGLAGGALLLSVREFKKASPRFFEEP